jgi:hypothetical protein
VSGKIIRIKMSWFKLHRQVFEHGIWTNPIELRLFFWLVGHAVFDNKDIHYSEVTVKRGQYLRSFRKLQEDLRYTDNNRIKVPSLGTIKRTVDKLVRKEMIAILETPLGTLFTIINYEKYQSNGTEIKEYEDKVIDENEGLGTGLGTATEQQRNNNKKDKKEKNISIAIFDHWNNSKIAIHRSLNQEIERKITSRLKEYKPEEIETAITNYSFILNNEEYYFNYKWTLKDFLQRGLDKFLDLETAKSNYRKNSITNNSPKQSNNIPEYLQ